jgi:hypothetical protein
MHTNLDHLFDRELKKIFTIADRLTLLQLDQDEVVFFTFNSKRGDYRKQSVILCTSNFIDSERFVIKSVKLMTGNHSPVLSIQSTNFGPDIFITTHDYATLKMFAKKGDGISKYLHDFFSDYMNLPDVDQRKIVHVPETSFAKIFAQTLIGEEKVDN